MFSSFQKTKCKRIFSIAYTYTSVLHEFQSAKVLSKMPSSIPTNQAATSNKKAFSFLLEQQVVEIFGKKLVNDSRCPGDKLSAAAVSRMYGVSDKTVRDIWRGRTWSRETQHMDPSRPLVHKQVGRPQGAKDKKPRKVRQGAGTLIQERMPERSAAHSAEADPMATGQGGQAQTFQKYNDKNEESEAIYAHHEALMYNARDPSFFGSSNCSKPYAQISGLMSIDDNLFEWAQTSRWCIAGLDSLEKEFFC
jgi:hypothetical protein